MKERSRIYAAIDLKSFYASVECVERKLNPLSTNLVVADLSRTDKTVCLAVTPPLKAYGISGRARLFEVNQILLRKNLERLESFGRRHFLGKSYLDEELQKDFSLQIDYIVAPPRMAKYIEYSSRIYSIYLKYIAPEDIHVYSIDEVFMDLTFYLESSRMSAEEFLRRIIHDIFLTTGITATAGIGENLYLAKIAMDIKAKKIAPDENGVRIASLTERSYREQMWDVTPITKFWRVGAGIAARLQSHGILTMGDVALCSVKNEELLYRLLGVNAELLIDHAWGYEPCTIEQIKAYRPSSSSLSCGQVLSEAYDKKHARTVVLEMAQKMAMDLTRKRLVASQVVLQIGYDAAYLRDSSQKEKYHGEISIDHYGREVPKSAHSSARLKERTSSATEITRAVMELFDRNTDELLPIRRVNLSACNLAGEDASGNYPKPAVEPDLFSDVEELKTQLKLKEEKKSKERHMLETVLRIKDRFGNNSILRGTSFREGATSRERNSQIGGHKA